MPYRLEHTVSPVEAAIVVALWRCKKACSPKQIITLIDPKLRLESAHLAFHLKRLVTRGLVTRNEINRRRVSYGLPDFTHLTHMEIEQDTDQIAVNYLKSLATTPDDTLQSRVKGIDE